MARAAGWKRVGGLALLVALVLLVRSRSSGNERAPEPTPSATVTATEISTETPRSTARLVPLSELDLSQNCELFDAGKFDLLDSSQVVAGERVQIELHATPCGTRALLPIRENDDRLVVAWRSSDDPELTVDAWFQYDLESDRWLGATRFDQVGLWVAPVESGFIKLVIVEWADYGFGAPVQIAATDGAPTDVGILEVDSGLARHWALAETTAMGWLRDPERVVFVQQRAHTNVLALGNIESGWVENVFEVGEHPTIAAAPDGRAAIVSWTDNNGLAQVRLVSAVGRVLTPELGTVRAVRFWWAPNSELLLAVTEDELLVLSPGGGVRLRHELRGISDPRVDWAPDSSYALLIATPVAGTQIARFDAETLAFETMVDGDIVLVDQDAITIGPTGILALAWWELPGAAAVKLGVIEPQELVGVDLEAHVAQRFEAVEPLHASLGGLSWSPEGDRLAFSTMGILIPGGSRNTTSSLIVLDVESSTVRELVGSEQFYTRLGESIVWTRDGEAIVARRAECNECQPDEFAYDVVSLANGSVSSSSTYPTAFADRSTRLLVLRSVLEDLDKPDAPPPAALDLVLASLFPGNTRAPSGAAQALAIGPDVGLHLYVTGGDANVLGILASFEVHTEVATLLGEQYVAVREGNRWVRVALADGTRQPYVASDVSGEGAALQVSPSGALALNLDASGFVVLDATEPEAEELGGWRAWPDGIGERREGLSWSSDESRFVIAGTGAVAVLDIRSGAAAVYPVDAMGVGLNPDEELGQPLAASWGVDGTSVLFATSEALWQLNPETGQASLIASAPRPGGFTAGAVLSPAPDGSAMAVGTAFGVFLPELGGEWRLISRVGVPANGGELYWAQDASAVAYAGVTVTGHPYGVIEVPVNGGEARLVAWGNDVLRVLGWLDGRRLVFGYQTNGE